MTTLPKSMRAAIYKKKGAISIEQRKLPAIGDDDVLLKINYCGVCGTDLHLVMDGWGEVGSIFGHEYSGQIVALGVNVQNWQMGQYVVGMPTPSCGNCQFCRQHRPSLCIGNTDIGLNTYQGAFADYKAVAANDLLLIPKCLNSKEAALCEPLAVAMHGITRSHVEPGMRVFISGCGPIGLLTLAVLVAGGITDITVSEPSAQRREHALKLGAAQVLSPDELKVPDLPTAQVAAPFDVAFETSGKASAIETAFGNLQRGASLVLMGTGLEAPRLDALRIILSEVIITGAYNYDENGFQNAMDLLASGKLALADLVEPESVPLEGLLPSMQALVKGELVGKVMINPGHSA